MIQVVEKQGEEKQHTFQSISYRLMLQCCSRARPRRLAGEAAITEIDAGRLKPNTGIATGWHPLKHPGYVPYF
jgi:hypothetical protein